MLSKCLNLFQRDESKNKCLIFKRMFVDLQNIGTAK